MDVREQIDRYIDDQKPAKSAELRDLHRRILAISPDAELWFLNGRNDDGKVVSNPNIGYGSQTLDYANGDSRAFYKLGLSANTSGLSVYVMGLKDKTYLSQTYGSRLGKAKVTGYCISFRSVKDVNLGVLEEVVADALGRPLRVARRFFNPVSPAKAGAQIEPTSLWRPIEALEREHFKRSV